MQNVGDYMLVGTDLGWHIIMYASDAVITEENEKPLVDAIFHNIHDTSASNPNNDAMKKWRE